MAHLLSATCLVLLLSTASASAQVFYGGGISVYGSPSYRVRPAIVGVPVSRFPSGSWGYGPYAGGYWGYPNYWGGFGGTVIVVARPVIIVPPPVIIIQQANAPAPAAPQGDVGVDPRRFKVIEPNKPADLPMPKKIDNAPAPVPKPAPIPKGKADPAAPDGLGARPNQLPLAPPRKEDGRPESARQVDLGRDAFAAGKYALAQERFQDALTAEPMLPIAHFMLAETYFALGNYTDAAQSLTDGLNLHPGWPASAFRPRELYGDHPAHFDEQIKELRAALALQEKDAKLLLVLGTQLWFDGSRDEARRLFEAAAMNGSTVARLFLDRGR